MQANGHGTRAYESSGATTPRSLHGLSESRNKAGGSDSEGLSFV